MSCLILHATLDAIVCCWHASNSCHGSAALDFPMYDASALAKEAESKLDGTIKQVCKAKC